MAREKLEFMFPREAGERGRLEYLQTLDTLVEEVKSNIHSLMSPAEWREYVSHKHDQDADKIRKEDLQLIKRKHEPSNAQSS